MKIHIETLLQRIEETEKRHRLDLANVESRMQELNRDKVRLEELLSIREVEVRKGREERDQMKAHIEKERLIKEGHIQGLKKELDEARRRVTEGALLERKTVIQQVPKRNYNNSSSPTENLNLKAKMKKDLIEIYQKSLIAPSPGGNKH